MRIMHVALGGCLAGPRVRFGATEDTGGHLAYVLGATAALARRADISAVDIVTRAFRGEGFLPAHADPVTPIDAKRRILRIRGGRHDYLEKAALEADLPALTASFLQLLEQGARPDIIHAHFADAAELALAARDAFGIPFLYSAHSLALLKPCSGSEDARARREDRAIETADAIVVSSRDEAECQIAAYRTGAAGRIWRVPPGVEIARDTSPARGLRLIAPFLREPTRPMVLAVARPVQKKNLSALVDAFGASGRLRDAANLVILAGQHARQGRGTREAERVVTDLFDRVDRLGLRGQVALPRSHDAEHVQSLYALAARDGVFANPARHEPFGLTVVEAAQHGVPVVATRNGGPAEILDEIGHGRVIDPDDTDGLAEACLALLSDPERSRHAARARDAATAFYDWDAWAHRVTGIARRLVAPRPRGGERASTVRQMLVSDIDGTLTGDHGGVARFRAHLSAHPDLAYVVATGRTNPEARGVLAEWDLPEPAWIIASVGSQIWRRRRDGSYALDEAFAERIGQGWQRDLVAAVVEAAGAHLQPPHAQSACKISLFGDAEEAARIEDGLRKKGLRARVIASHGRFVDILPAAAGKARAAAWLARQLGLGPTDCIAAGDSGNDRDMLLWAGAAILPANALPELDDLAAPGLLRTRSAHASGVVEGLVTLSAGASGRDRAIAAE